MLKNAYLEPYVEQKQNLSDFEKNLLANNENHKLFLEKPLSLYRIKKLPNENMQKFIDDILNNKDINTLLYASNVKKEQNYFLKQNKKMLRNNQSNKTLYPFITKQRMRPCESLFFKKKKELVLKEIKINVAKYKIEKSESLKKLKIKIDEFIKNQTKIKNETEKLYEDPINTNRIKSYQRTLYNCLKKSQSFSEFKLPDIYYNKDDVFSRLYYNMIYYPIKIKIDNNNKTKNKKSPLKKHKRSKTEKKFEIKKSNNKNSIFIDTEERKKTKKMNLKHIIKESCGKEFLIRPTLSVIERCFSKTSGGPNVKQIYLKKLNFNKFKAQKSKHFLSSDGSIEDDPEPNAVDINDYRDDNLNTNLHIAVMNNDIKFVKYFLFKNCNPDEKNIFGQTPLHIAVQNQNYDIIKLLIDDDADITIQDNKGETPYSLASIDIKNKFQFNKLLMMKPSY